MGRRGDAARIWALIEACEPPTRRRPPGAARIWREQLDPRTGAVTRLDDDWSLSPLTLLMNRLYRVETLADVSRDDSRRKSRRHQPKHDST